MALDDELTPIRVAFPTEPHPHLRLQPTGRPWTTDDPNASLHAKFSSDHSHWNSHSIALANVYNQAPTRGRPKHDQLMVHTSPIVYGVNEQQQQQSQMQFNAPYQSDAQPYHLGASGYSPVSEMSMVSSPVQASPYPSQLPQAGAGNSQVDGTSDLDADAEGEMDDEVAREQITMHMPNQQMSIVNDRSETIVYEQRGFENGGIQAPPSHPSPIPPFPSPPVLTASHSAHSTENSSVVAHAPVIPHPFRPSQDGHVLTSYKLSPGIPPSCIKQELPADDSHIRSISTDQDFEIESDCEFDSYYPPGSSVPIRSRKVSSGTTCSSTSSALSSLSAGSALSAFSAATTGSTTYSSEAEIPSPVSPSAPDHLAFGASSSPCLPPQSVQPTPAVASYVQQLMTHSNAVPPYLDGYSVSGYHHSGQQSVLASPAPDHLNQPSTYPADVTPLLPPHGSLYASHSNEGVAFHNFSVYAGYSMSPEATYYSPASGLPNFVPPQYHDQTQHENAYEQTMDSFVPGSMSPNAAPGLSAHEYASEQPQQEHLLRLRLGNVPTPLTTTVPLSLAHTPRATSSSVSPPPIAIDSPYPPLQACMGTQVPGQASTSGICPPSLKRRTRSTRPLAPPTPVPNLTKKSRGRRVPTAASLMLEHADSPRRATRRRRLDDSAVIESDPDRHDDDFGQNGVRGWSVDKSGLGVVGGLVIGKGKAAKAGRSFVCQAVGCGKLFARGEHLKRHVRSIHTNDKPHRCPQEGCGKYFSRYDNLGQHMRVHRDPGRKSVGASSDASC